MPRKPLKYRLEFWADENGNVVGEMRPPKNTEEAHSLGMDMLKFFVGSLTDEETALTISYDNETGAMRYSVLMPDEEAPLTARRPAS